MQEDFHYYATYAAAIIAGYSHEDGLDIAYSAQFVDLCSRTLLNKIKAPEGAATTQLQLEMMDARTDLIGLQDITRIWASFHFLPGNLYAEVEAGSKRYKDRYRLICNPNSVLVRETVQLAKNKPVQAAGVAMHVLADTWAHRYFAGTPSLVINNTNHYFYELLPDEKWGVSERKIRFRHSPSTPDDLEAGLYTNSVYQPNENSIMNLGHGRAGHLPDYSFMRYKYLPAWGRYREIIKDNPTDYMHAFTQMVHALKFLRGVEPLFKTGQYDFDAISPWREEIVAILTKRQLDACADWKAFGEKLSGETIEDFDMNKYQAEYVDAPKKEKDDTFLGKFILAALAQKSMVTSRIYSSGNLLAGYSTKAHGSKVPGIRDFQLLMNYLRRGMGQ